jgi:hypothetical protein
MTGFLRLGNQDVFSRIPVTRGKAVLTATPGLGIEVNHNGLSQLASRAK